jgi:hypothetical protein
VRLASYISTLRHELIELGHACGVTHPILVGQDGIEILDGHLATRSLQDIFKYDPAWMSFDRLPTELNALLARSIA